jgi:hypothetical protein
MVQFRRLDPLANAGPWQRATKRGVKTFTLSEEQFDRVAEKRPELIVSDGDSIVLGRPHRGILEIHYAFPEVPAFRDEFKPLLFRCLAASNREEAPRGVVLAFRDRPNRPLAEQLFWEAAFEESKHWVECDYNAVPEQPDPSSELKGGYTVREAKASDREAIASIEAEAMGLPRLSDAALDGLYENSRWLYIIEDASGKAIAWLGMRREPAGWAIIEDAVFSPSAKASAFEPAIRWASAFLRNNGGRRQRRRVNLDDNDELATLRAIGFVPAETGVDYVRPVEDEDIRAKVEERQAHGTLIKFGDWR